MYLAYSLDSKILCKIDDDLQAVFRVVDFSKDSVYLVPNEGNKILGVWHFRKDQNSAIPTVTRLDLSF